MDKHTPRSNLLADFGPFFSMELPADTKLRSTTGKKDFKTTPLTSSLCYCGQLVKVGEVKKEGPNHGKTFYTCACKLYNTETKESFGGCVYFQFKGDTVPHCSGCALPMRMFKNIISTAQCMNNNCKLKVPNITEEERGHVIRVIGTDQCTCGEEAKIFKRGDGCSVTCGRKGQDKCAFRVGLDLKTEKIYFMSH